VSELSLETSEQGEGFLFLDADYAELTQTYADSLSIIATQFQEICGNQLAKNQRQSGSKNRRVTTRIPEFLPQIYTDEH
jgi:hypothetical protein